MTSYVAWFTFAGEPDACNALRFATEAEAAIYASDLLSRWMLPTGYVVRESADPVNARCDRGVLELCLQGIACTGSDCPVHGGAACNS